MANYPQLDNARGVWNLREVYDAVMGGYWPNHASRGLCQGGGSPSETVQLDEITIASAGNAVDFGDIATSTSGRNGYSSFIRGMFAGGSPAGSVNNIDYVTIATRGNAADFGDLTTSTDIAAGTSNSVRGLTCLLYTSDAADE